MLVLRQILKPTYGGARAPSAAMEDDTTNKVALAQAAASAAPSLSAQTQLEPLQKPVIMRRIEAVSAEAAAGTGRGRAPPSFAFGGPRAPRPSPLHQFQTNTHASG